MLTRVPYFPQGYNNSLQSQELIGEARQEALESNEELRYSHQSITHRASNCNEIPEIHVFSGH